MKTWNVILKSLREQIRSYWVLLLTLSLGPFFIFVYFLIVESSKTSYDIQVQNNDTGVIEKGAFINYGAAFLASVETWQNNPSNLPFKIKQVKNKAQAIKNLQQKSADMLIVIPDSFSVRLSRRKINPLGQGIPAEIYGDLTSQNYLICSVWANEWLNDFLYEKTGSEKMINVKETALGTSASISEFEMVVPGILVLSIIMLMFTASIAFVSEVENKTILRLKLSKLTAFEFLGGIGIVQSLIGIVAMVLTLLTAIMLGFSYEGSILIMLIIGTLTSLSIIAFSLIIAAVTKSSNEVLIIGNFPMFLFMFFTGAAFPMKSNALFTIAGYPFSIQGLMSPVHAISALNKTLVMNMSLSSILPEMITLLLLTILYFWIGAIIFNRKHLKIY